MVGLGMAFLLLTAMLGVMKAHTAPIFNESNMLYIALVFYAGAGALYMGFGVTGVEKYVKVASSLRPRSDSSRIPWPRDIAGISRDVRHSRIFTRCC